MEFATGVPIIISLFALLFSVRATRFSKENRQQDRKEKAAQLLSDLRIEHAALVADTGTARRELGMLKIEWLSENPVRNIVLAERGLDLIDQSSAQLKEVIDSLHYSDKDYEHQSKEIIDLIGRAKSTRHQAQEILTSIRSTRADISNYLDQTKGN